MSRRTEFELNEAIEQWSEAVGIWSVIVAAAEQLRDSLGPVGRVGREGDAALAYAQRMRARAEQERCKVMCTRDQVRYLRKP